MIGRAKLHTRLICSDELELCAYFLLDKKYFLPNTSRNEVFISLTDMHNLFDELYQVGLGFKNEQRLERKLNRNDFAAYKTIEIANIIGLKKVYFTPVS